MPGTPDQIHGAAGASSYHVVSAGSTNAAVVKGSPGVLVGYYLVNTAATFRYVKLYNKATTPSPGSDTPRATFGIPPLSGANIALQFPVAYETGIGVAIVLNIADNDSTAVGANEVSVTLWYI